MAPLKDELLYDKRLIERHIAKGMLTPQEVEQRLNQMPDLENYSDVISWEELTKSNEKPKIEEEVSGHT